MPGLQAFRWYAWGLMTVAVIIVAVLNSRFIWIDLSEIMHRAMDHVGRHDFELYLHLWTAPLILVSGAVLFLPGLRNGYPIVHRWAGRCYLTAVLVTSVATFRLALHETEGLFTVIGFAIASVLWFVTAAMAWLRAMQGQFKRHGDWMIRNYALTLTNVTFRIELHALLFIGMDFNTIYEPIRVLQWIPNLIIAEILIISGFFERERWGDLWPWSRPIMTNRLYRDGTGRA